MQRGSCAACVALAGSGCANYTNYANVMLSYVCRAAAAAYKCFGAKNTCSHVWSIQHHKSQSESSERLGLGGNPFCSAFFPSFLTFIPLSIPKLTVPILPVPLHLPFPALSSPRISGRSPPAAHKPKTRARTLKSNSLPAHFT